jgi:hypothetical protein
VKPLEINWPTTVGLIETEAKDDLMDNFVQRVQDLRIAGRYQVEDDMMLTKVSVWLSNLENPRWLLVFDNYDDPDQFTIREYFPSVAQGSIIVRWRQKKLYDNDRSAQESRQRAEQNSPVRIFHS